MDRALWPFSPEGSPVPPPPPVWFDYENQAWVIDGRYVRCGHLEGMDCECYGRAHQGERAPVSNYLPPVV